METLLLNERNRLSGTELLCGVRSGLPVDIQVRGRQDLAPAPRSRRILRRRDWTADADLPWVRHSYMKFPLVSEQLVPKIIWPCHCQ